MDTETIVASLGLFYRKTRASSYHFLFEDSDPENPLIIISVQKTV